MTELLEMADKDLKVSNFSKMIAAPVSRKAV